MIKIKKNEECNGCHACSNICPVQCIEMKEDFEGFKYPEVNYDKCIKCNMCMKVCPLIEPQKIEENDPQAFACFNKDEKIRMESSSGGIFTLLAEKILDDNGVIFGAAWTEDFKLKHKYIEDRKELKQFRGSKYLQSEIRDSFREILDFLKGGRKVLFSGTPCQIGGLKSYINKKTNNKGFKNLLCVDFICHGVPSPKVWKKYINEKQKNEGLDFLNISFRDKTKSWKKYDLRFDSDKNSFKELASTNKYMRAFLTDICLRPACYECGFKSKGRVSDITMADFWGIQNVKPELDDDKGTSLILVHSELGNKIYKSILKNIVSEEVEVDKALKFNSAATKSVKPHQKRSEYFKELEVLTFDELHEKYVKLSLIVRFKKKVRLYVIAILRRLGLR